MYNSNKNYCIYLIKLLFCLKCVPIFYFIHFVIILNSENTNEYILHSTELIELSVNNNHFNNDNFISLDWRDTDFYSGKKLYKNSQFYKKMFMLSENIMNSEKCSAREYCRQENKYDIPIFFTSHS